MTEEELKRRGYKIENAKITKVSLSFADHAVLTLNLTLEGRGWGCCYGGYVLGHGCLGGDYFSSTEKAMVSVMKIMDTVGVETLESVNGKLVRAAFKGTGSSPVEWIGNIIEDKWYSNADFFSEGRENG